MLKINVEDQKLENGKRSFTMDVTAVGSEELLARELHAVVSQIALRSPHILEIMMYLQKSGVQLDEEI